ncbi:MAG: glycosyl transferase, partial [Flavobacterium sp.]
MQIGHIILAHKDPLQLQRLVKSILNKDSIVIIHLDLKSDMRVFSNISEIPNAYFTKNRLSVNWGGYSQVEAVIRSLDELMKLNPNLEYINLLSGQDYPVQKLSKFHEFLKRNPGRAFMEFLPSDNPWVVNAGERFNKYHLSDHSFFGKFKVERLMNLLLPKRSFPKDFILTGRSQWFTIDSECARYILHVIRCNGKLIRNFKFSWGADELFFQSLIYNSPLKDKLINDNLRYIDWSENQSSPKTLTIIDIEQICHSKSFFARKFDFH